MTAKEISLAVGDISTRYILEAAIQREGRADRPALAPTRKRIMLIAAAVICMAFLCAFAVSLFSPLDGDALTLEGVYEGNGIVSVRVENKSEKSIRFQSKVKLVEWITGKEIAQLDGMVSIEGAAIAPNSEAIMRIDLSSVYDIPMLEDSHPWMWYYLVLTNRDFAYGQEWKCSINFAPQEQEQPSGTRPRYSLDPKIVAQVEEELRFYFEDDYIGIFAADPNNYAYLQKAQELLLRSGKRIVPMADSDLICMPIPDGVTVDDAFPPEKQYTLAGNSSSVHDAFGKLVGSTESEHIKTVDVYLPQRPGEEDSSWMLPVIYLASFETAAVEGPEDCAFIHGQIVSFAELASYRVYEDERFICFDVTHLFYTDLRDYAENVAAKERAGGALELFLDERLYARMQNIYDWYRQELTVVSLEEYEKRRPSCVISGQEITADGPDGLIESDTDITKVVITVARPDGENLLEKEYVPSDRRIFSLREADTLQEEMSRLDRGEYVLDVTVWLDSEIMRCQSLWSIIFVKE